MTQNQKSTDSLNLRLTKSDSNHGNQEHELDTTNQAKIQRLPQLFTQ